MYTAQGIVGISLTKFVCINTALRVNIAHAFISTANLQNIFPVASSATGSEIAEHIKK